MLGGCAGLLLLPAWCCQLLEPTQDGPGISSGMGHPLLGSADPRLLLQKKDFPSHSFYVVVVVKTEDEACGGALHYYPLSKDASPGLQWGCHRGLCVGTSWGQDRAEPCPCCLPDKPVDQPNRQKTLEVMVSPAITCESGRGWGCWALWAPTAGLPRCQPH